jgi:divalent metal cation (Fe/Co/Zn/Cd) transporter
VVLGIALLFDLYSWKVSYRELFAGQSPSTTWLSRIRSSKDPSVFTVFLEDSAAIAATIIAFFGILLSQVFHNHYFDGVASLMIGILLGGVALFLGRESGALLLGKSVAPETARRLKSLIESDPAVEQVGDLLTMLWGQNRYCST